MGLLGLNFEIRRGSYSGRSRGGARGTPPPPPCSFWVKKEKITEGRKVSRASETKTTRQVHCKGLFDMNTSILSTPLCYVLYRFSSYSRYSYFKKESYLLFSSNILIGGFLFKWPGLSGHTEVTL